MVAHARLVVVGSDSQRLHEELISAGGRLREGRFTRMNVGEMTAALAAAGDLRPAEAIERRLLEVWPRHADALIAALEVRMRDRVASLERTLADRATQEVAAITAVLTELRQSILAQLNAEPVQQLELFSGSEGDQLERDVASLRGRADGIPAEIDEETAAIRRRFAHPTPRLFPVSVTLLVPERHARG
jgi:hypothetical protein